MKSFSFLLWLVFCISSLLVAIGSSWQIHKTFNFGYPLWYKILEIEQHIDEYAPQNNYAKQDFITTSSTEHFRLFADINKAIHNNGIGLVEIAYNIESNETAPPYSKALLTESEIIHLEDVANLIENLTVIWQGNVLILLFCAALIYWKKAAPPSLKQQWSIMAFVISICTIILYSTGFTKVFYGLHEIVFPENHQWFFYYQDSLMSTLMKAPDLFSMIAMSIFFIAIFIFWILQKTLYRCAYYYG